MPRCKSFCEQAVLQKAVELFWARGYHATSIQDLVDHLGINRASLYDTYGGKGQLFKTALSSYQKKNLEKLKKFLNSFDDVKEGFRELFNSKIQESIPNDRRGCLLVNTVTELIPEDEGWLEYLQDRKQDVIDVFESYILTGKKSGQFNSDLHVQSTAKLLYMLYAGLNVMVKMETDIESLTQGVFTGLTVLE